MTTSRCVCLLSAAECAGVQEMALGAQPELGWLPSHPQLLSPATAAALPAGTRLPGLMPRSAGTHGEQDSEHTQQEAPSQEQLSSHPGGGQGQLLHKDGAGIQGREMFCCLDKLPGSAVGQLLWGSLSNKPGEAGVWQPSRNVPSESI